MSGINLENVWKSKYFHLVEVHPGKCPRSCQVCWYKAINIKIGLLLTTESKRKVHNVTVVFKDFKLRVTNI